MNSQTRDSMTGWGFFQQGSDQTQEMMELGAELSIRIHCPVHYPAFGRRVFECKCGVIFPLYMVQPKDWANIDKHHKKGYRPEEV